MSVTDEGSDIFDGVVEGDTTVDLSTGMTGSIAGYSHLGDNTGKYELGTFLVYNANNEALLNFVSGSWEQVLSLLKQMKLTSGILPAISSCEATWSEQVHIYFGLILMDREVNSKIIGKVFSRFCAKIWNTFKNTHQGVGVLKKPQMTTHTKSIKKNGVSSNKPSAINRVAVLSSNQSSSTILSSEENKAVSINDEDVDSVNKFKFIKSLRNAENAYTSFY